jgi:hypothetical protein
VGVYQLPRVDSHYHFYCHSLHVSDSPNSRDPFVSRPRKDIISHVITGSPSELTHPSLTAPGSLQLPGELRYQWETQPYHAWDIAHLSPPRHSQPIISRDIATLDISRDMPSLTSSPKQLNNLTSPGTTPGTYSWECLTPGSTLT